MAPISWPDCLSLLSSELTGPPLTCCCLFEAISPAPFVSNVFGIACWVLIYPAFPIFLSSHPAGEPQTSLLRSRGQSPYSQALYLSPDSTGREFSTAWRGGSPGSLCCQRGRLKIFLIKLPHSVCLYLSSYHVQLPLPTSTSPFLFLWLEQAFLGAPFLLGIYCFPCISFLEGFMEDGGGQLTDMPCFVF